MILWWFLSLSVFGFDCTDRVFSKLAPETTLNQPEGFNRTSPPESKTERTDLGLESTYTQETLKSLETFLDQADIPLRPGPEALTDSAAHHKKWKADVDAFLAGAGKEQAAKLREQFESIYLDYLENPPKQSDGSYLPGLDLGTPLKPQPLGELFKNPDAVAAHGLVERTLRNSGEGFEGLLELPPKDMDKHFRRIALVRANYLMVRIFQKVKQDNSTP